MDTIKQSEQITQEHQLSPVTICRVISEQIETDLSSEKLEKCTTDRDTLREMITENTLLIGSTIVVAHAKRTLCQLGELHLLQVIGEGDTPSSYNVLETTVDINIRNEPKTRYSFSDRYIDTATFPGGNSQDIPVVRLTSAIGSYSYPSNAGEIQAIYLIPPETLEN